MTSELFTTLADPTRRALIEALLGGEQAVGDLVERVSIRQSGVSRHLRILADGGFVQSRADGTKRLYSLRAEPFQQLSSWVDRYRWLWEARLDRFGEALEARRTGGSAEPSKGQTS